MKLRNIIKSTLIGLVAAGMVAGIGMGHARAQQIPYVPGQPLESPTTPAFNIYTNVPAGVGNEADFVKLRNSNGDPTVNAATNNFVDPLNSACNVGDMFDIRTYVHNGAAEESNDNGNGTGVAHNVTVSMDAPLGVTADDFRFESTISASNAASVTDTGLLNCDEDVQLELVPQTVRVYSGFYGWQSAPDSAVNGDLTIGSRSVGSGDVWGCWEDRVVIVYVVRVVETPSYAACSVLDMNVIGDRRVQARVEGEVTNAEIIGYRIAWGDDTFIGAQEAEHEYSQYGSYTIRGYVNAQYANGETEWITGENCVANVNFTENEKPEVVTPTVIPNTGAGSIAGIFAATSIGGAIAHRLYAAREMFKR